jgi:hypothetical protein
MSGRDDHFLQPKRDPPSLVICSGGNPMTGEKVCDEKKWTKCFIVFYTVVGRNSLYLRPERIMFDSFGLRRKGATQDPQLARMGRDM